MEYERKLHWRIFSFTATYVHLCRRNYVISVLTVYQTGEKLYLGRLVIITFRFSAIIKKSVFSFTQILYLFEMQTLIDEIHQHKHVSITLTYFSSAFMCMIIGRSYNYEILILSIYNIFLSIDITYKRFADNYSFSPPLPRYLPQFNVTIHLFISL